MKNSYKNHPWPYYMNMCPYWSNQYFYNHELWEDFLEDYDGCEEYAEDYNSAYSHTWKKNCCSNTRLKDYGPKPLVINIEAAAKENKNFRTALWTGKHLQLTLMSIDVGKDIGLEIHPYLDQFIRIEEGQGIVKMGSRKDKLDFEARVSGDFILIIPAGTWHNLINTGNKPIKLYSIYSPPQHPWGTVHKTKADAEEAEKRQNR
ncbi:cupin domain-containing protein [Lutispora thermophila]|mgnify:CR=1 FL=1|uniref:Mannose-6-phosphate isomerase, cupin superfamily n=1 Tax=Lutispora thermophila DSM 19022 TaxID=1122184 RepID=A0A1M6CA45_9FIRM|nr:cupin domain-containing protein [Lutispora thermophila]SHI57890.1 Mannose-6-phosphate isomerase, cupin superfamily [Lutispora thermophila DSM 19022]